MLRLQRRMDIWGSQVSYAVLDTDGKSPQQLADSIIAMFV